MVSMVVVNMWCLSNLWGNIALYWIQQARRICTVLSVWWCFRTWVLGFCRSAHGCWRELRQPAWCMVINFQIMLRKGIFLVVWRFWQGAEEFEEMKCTANAPYSNMSCFWESDSLGWMCSLEGEEVLSLIELFTIWWDPSFWVRVETFLST